MTPDALRDALLRRGHPEAGLVADPAALLQHLEAEAELRPTDVVLRGLAEAAHGLLTCADGLPAVIGGVRRGAVVRWDAWSVTFEGADLHSGGMAMVRTLRAHAQRDGALRRALLRDGRALLQRHPELRANEAGLPALVLPLPGPPFSAERWAEGPARDGLVLARLLTSGLADLARAERDGLGLPAPGSLELRDTTAGLAVCCLTPWPTAETGAAVSALAAALARHEAEDEEGPLDGVLAGIGAFGAQGAQEVGATVARALGAWLAARRHPLAARADRVQRGDRVLRLSGVVERLATAAPPPAGIALVGIDLDGRVLTATSDPGGLRWGPADAPPSEVWSPARGLHAEEARRLARMAALAPPTPRLLRLTSASPSVTAALPRWLAAQLELAALRDALSASGSTRPPR